MGNEAMVQQLDRIASNTSFTLSDNSRKTLRDAADLLSWLGRQADFRAAVKIEPIVVLCVRDPDASNDFTVTGDEVRIIDIDLGYADLGQWGEFATWANSSLGEAATLPEGSPIRERIEEIVWSAFERNSENDEFPDLEDTDQLRTAVEGY